MRNSSPGRGRTVGAAGRWATPPTRLTTASTGRRVAPPVPAPPPPLNCPPLTAFCVCFCCCCCLLRARASCSHAHPPHTPHAHSCSQQAAAAATMSRQDVRQDVRRSSRGDADASKRAGIGNEANQSPGNFALTWPDYVDDGRLPNPLVKFALENGVDKKELFKWQGGCWQLDLADFPSEVTNALRGDIADWIQRKDTYGIHFSSEDIATAWADKLVPSKRRRTGNDTVTQVVEEVPPPPPPPPPPPLVVSSLPPPPPPPIPHRPHGRCPKTSSPRRWRRTKAQGSHFAVPLLRWWRQLACAEGHAGIAPPRGRRR